LSAHEIDFFLVGTARNIHDRFFHNPASNNQNPVANSGNVAGSGVSLTLLFECRNNADHRQQ
jgi:hypothetical protein